MDKGIGHRLDTYLVYLICLVSLLSRGCCPCSSPSPARDNAICDAIDTFVRVFQILFSIVVVFVLYLCDTKQIQISPNTLHGGNCSCYSALPWPGLQTFPLLLLLPVCVLLICGATTKRNETKRTERKQTNDALNNDSARCRVPW